MKRRGFFAALTAACATPIVAKAAPRNVEEDVRKAMEASWRASAPGYVDGPWVATHSHCVTDPGHTHSIGSYQRDHVHSHHVHYVGDLGRA